MNLSGHLIVGVATWLASTVLVFGQTTATNLPAVFIRVALPSAATNVFVQRAGAAVWDPAYDGQALQPGDRLQTREHARLMLILPDGSTMRVGELSDLEIQAEPTTRSQLGLLLRRARLYFFHRGEPTDLKIRTRTASAAVRGTEFNLEAEEEGQFQIAVFDGQVLLRNDLGEVLVQNGEQGAAIPGRPPSRTAVIETVNIIQWCLYYPAVLDLEELNLPPETKTALSQSLEAYRAGDLLKALATYPTGRQPESPHETLYFSALLLSVGKVAEAETMLTLLETTVAGQAEAVRVRRLTDALRKMVAAVKGQNFTNGMSPELASEWLAESYYRQSRSDLKNALEGALEAARKAAEVSPAFGFAWARVAELEFCFGRIGRAQEALDKALELSARNAQALALKGFILAARNKIRDAFKSFDEAIAVDNALGNAWLGRGLCRIREGRLQEGVEDLQVAVTAEPQRAILRSYLGKGYAVNNQDALAAHELGLARDLDPKDPTAWLYLALLNRDLHRFNQGIRDLEKSVELNDNRQLYRSQMLLDQDRAVRGTSLATIYRDAGMDDVAYREAAKAVTYDYANYSAHLFLANSLDALRDPTRFNLRYETAWFSELLLANALAPAGAGVFAQTISQQEYSRLFDVKRLGLASTTDVRSDGQSREIVSQFGNFKSFSYSLDLDCQHNDDVGAHGRPNNELNRIEWYSQFKFQLSPQDSLFLLTKYQDYHSGDNFQYYDWRTQVRTNFMFDEYQSPILVGVYHHEWSPGIHTLLLAGRLENDQRFSDLAVRELIVTKQTTDENATVTHVRDFPFDVKYRSEFEAYTAELNQIFQGERQILVLGGRFQTGQFDTRNEFKPVMYETNFPVTSAESTDDFQRATAYAYYTVEPAKSLFLTAGLSYDEVVFPENHRSPPTSPGVERRDLLGPKAALVYSPFDWITLRGVYTRSLGGVTLDQSFRLEPTQLAGFIQTFRSVIPESVVGSVSAPTFETYGAAADLRFKTGTYIGIQAEMLSSDVQRTIGVFDDHIEAYPVVIVPSSTRERLDFDERAIGITVNQLLADQWACGVSYKFTSSELNAHLVELDTPAAVANGFTNANNTARSGLHHFGAYVLFNHPSGFFARAEANWYAQDNILRTHDTTSARVEIDLPSDEFTQFNLYVGYRFPRQRGDMTLGVLNLGGGDYHLNPLNSYAELPRERVFAAQWRFRF